MRDSAGNILGSSKSSQIGPYGGGFVTSFGITDDAKVMVHGTDVGGGYVWGENDKLWRHAISYETYPDLDNIVDSLGYSNGDGVYSMDIAPSNGQVGYLVFRGHVFATKDQFRTVSLVPNIYVRAYANGGDHRINTDKLKIDPVDPNTFVLGTEGSGAYYSIDGGASMQPISGLPAVTTGAGDTFYHISVAVDRTSPTVNGRKQRWVLFVPGSGLWMTTTGPNGTWSKVAGAPNPPVMDAMFFDKDGILWAVSSVNQTIWARAVNGTWSVKGSWPAKAFAVLGNGQKVMMEANGSMNWTSVDQPDVITNDIVYAHYPLPESIRYIGNHVRWLTKAPVQLFPSKLMGDPVDPKKFWLVHGTGIAYCMLPDAMNGKPESVINFQDKSEGNAMLVTIRTEFTPEGRLLRSSWDKPTWTGVTDEEIEDPSFYAPPVGVEHGWDIDYVPGKPETIVALVNWNANYSGMSKDGGRTYTKLGNHPAGFAIGGNMGFVSETEGYWLPANNGRACYTIDGGSTWQVLDFVSKDGTVLAPVGETGWSFAYYFRKKNLLISKEEPGVAYAWNYGPPNQPQMRGFYRKEAGSQEFKHVFQGMPLNFSVSYFAYHMSLYEVTGHPGYIIMTSGQTDDQAQSVFTTDAGKTWNRLLTRINGQGPEYPLVNCSALGFGKAAPGAAYPAIRFSAELNGQRGIWETFDNFVSARMIEKAPLGYSQGVHALAGHPKKFGLWYYAVGQLGWVKAVQKHTLRFS